VAERSLRVLAKALLNVMVAIPLGFWTISTQAETAEGSGLEAVLNSDARLACDLAPRTHVGTLRPVSGVSYSETSLSWSTV
jgi:hypothetical protein